MSRWSTLKADAVIRLVTLRLQVMIAGRECPREHVQKQEEMCAEIVHK